MRDARALAKDGLVEARRAVAALSIGDVGESDADQRASGDAVRAEVEALVAAHRSLGGAARLVETGRRRQVSAAVSTALRRAVQEALTNARKHASGEPVTVTLLWATDGVSVEIANPLGASAGVGGGGHGLVGMRDRFTALPGGTVTSGVERGRFVVTARAATA